MDDSINNLNQDPRKQLCNLSIIDYEFAVEHVGGNKKIVDELLIMLVEWIPGIRDIIEQAYERHDFETIADYTHQIKGATSYCGAKRLHWISDFTDAKIRRKETDNIGDILSILTDEINLVISHYKENTRHNP